MKLPKTRESSCKWSNFISSRERLLFVVARFVGRDIGNAYGSGRGRIWLDQVECNGSENDIADCSHNAWGSHDCRHSEDVSIRCIGMHAAPSDRGTSRLSHGTMLRFFVKCNDLCYGFSMSRYPK